MKKIVILITSLLLFSSSLFSIKEKKIILFETMPVFGVLEHSKWNLKEIMHINKKNNENIKVKVINIKGDRKKGRYLLKKALKKNKVDLVVTNATMATQIAYKMLKKKKIPILFFTVVDPVGAGVIKKVGQPTNENITGKVYTISRDIKLNIIYRLFSQYKKTDTIRMGFIHSSYPSSVSDLKEFKKATSKNTKIKFIPYLIQYKKVPAGLPKMLAKTKKAIKKLEKKIDCWVEPIGPLGEVVKYTKTLLKYSKKPICFAIKNISVKLGALFFISPDMKKSGEKVAQLAYNILKGENPGKIPPLPHKDFKLGVNLSTALKYKIIIPQDILELAGEHVYK